MSLFIFKKAGPISVNDSDFANLWGFYFRETSHMWKLNPPKNFWIYSICCFFWLSCSKTGSIGLDKQFLSVKLWISSYPSVLTYLPGVLWWLSGSSSRCHGVVCSLWLWYFLIILTYYFWVLKRTVSLKLFFWVPTTYVLVKKYENYFFGIHS